MGGMGSGRTPSGRKSRDLIRFDLADLKLRTRRSKGGIIEFSWSGETVARVTFQIIAQVTEDHFGSITAYVEPFRQGGRCHHIASRR